MTNNIALSIKKTRDRIIAALNESQLNPCILEPVLNAIYQQVAQAAVTEIAEAEKQAAEEAQDNG